MATKAYRGKYPNRIKIVSGLDRGAVKVTTYGGESLIVKAIDTKGVHPKLGEDISKYKKNPARKTLKVPITDPVVRSKKRMAAANRRIKARRAGDSSGERTLLKHSVGEVGSQKVIAKFATRPTAIQYAQAMSDMTGKTHWVK